MRRGRIKNNADMKTIRERPKNYEKIESVGEKSEPTKQRTENLNWQRGEKLAKKCLMKVEVRNYSTKRKRRQRESKEKRESILHDFKRRSEERIRSETPDQRENRLEILKRNTATRIVSVTTEQRATRQEVVKRITAKRIDLMITNN